MGTNRGALRHLHASLYQRDQTILPCLLVSEHHAKAFMMCATLVTIFMPQSICDVCHPCDYFYAPALQEPCLKTASVYNLD